MAPARGVHVQVPGAREHGRSLPGRSRDAPVDVRTGVQRLLLRSGPEDQVDGRLRSARLLSRCVSLKPNLPANWRVRDARVLHPPITILLILIAWEYDTVIGLCGISLLAAQPGAV